MLLLMTIFLKSILVSSLEGNFTISTKKPIKALKLNEVDLIEKRSNDSVEGKNEDNFYTFEGEPGDQLMITIENSMSEYWIEVIVTFGTEKFDTSQFWMWTLDGAQINESEYLLSSSKNQLRIGGNDSNNSNVEHTFGFLLPLTVLCQDKVLSISPYEITPERIDMKGMITSQLSDNMEILSYLRFFITGQDELLGNLTLETGEKVEIGHSYPLQDIYFFPSSSNSIQQLTYVGTGLNNSTNECFINIYTCPTNCLKCEYNNSTNNTDCNECIMGYNNKLINKCIRDCYPNCKLCTDDQTCITCEDTYYRKEDELKRCFSGIIPGFYLDTNIELYKSCMKNCKECSDNHQCLNCDEGFYNMNSDCVFLFDNNYFVNSIEELISYILSDFYYFYFNYPIIYGSNFTTEIVEISSVLDEGLSNTTKMNFTKCEELIRDEYEIPVNQPLYMIKSDVISPYNQSLTNFLSYQIVDEKGNKLNYSICNETKIDIYYPMRDVYFDRNKT